MRNKLQKGFTLVELLVVISIMGFLSSIVFAGVSAIKKDGNNTFRNKSATEYIKAFSLYYDTYGEYPNPNNPTVQWYCISKFPLECEFGFFMTPRPSNTTINNAISEYIEVQEPFPVIQGEPFGWQGLLYQCTLDINGKCVAGVFLWFIEGDDVCGAGVGGVYNLGTDMTFCELVLE